MTTMPNTIHFCTLFKAFSHKMQSCKKTFADIMDRERTCLLTSAYFTLLHSCIHTCTLTHCLSHVTTCTFLHSYAGSFILPQLCTSWNMQHCVQAVDTCPIYLLTILSPDMHHFFSALHHIYKQQSILFVPCLKMHFPHLDHLFLFRNSLAGEYYWV